MTGSFLVPLLYLARIDIHMADYHHILDFADHMLDSADRMFDFARNSNIVHNLLARYYTLQIGSLI